jgi:hypothetical protein
LNQVFVGEYTARKFRKQVDSSRIGITIISNIPIPMVVMIKRPMFFRMSLKARLIAREPLDIAAMLVAKGQGLNDVGITSPSAEPAKLILLLNPTQIVQNELTG